MPRHDGSVWTAQFRHGTSVCLPPGRGRAPRREEDDAVRARNVVHHEAVGEPNAHQRHPIRFKKTATDVEGVAACTGVDPRATPPGVATQSTRVGTAAAPCAVVIWHKGENSAHGPLLAADPLDRGEILAVYVAFLPKADGTGVCTRPDRTHVGRAMAASRLAVSSGWISRSTTTSRAASTSGRSMIRV
jgi:hypothetical protein